jgi:glycosyltransferase involved in cell wall biosynthesis
VIDHLITGSGYLVPEVKQIAPKLPCTGVPYGIPINPSWQPRDPNPTEPLRLIYYGRLENASKGVRLFPEIAAALNRRRIPFRWTIHGTGPEEEFLHTALTDEEQAGRVRFSKPIPHNQLPGLVRAHDVYLLTSTNEGGPQTLLESMAMGLVPVCGDIPCLVQDVIRPSNGFRVPRDQPDAYAEAIGQLHADRARLEQLSHAAREAITRDNSSRRMAEQYLEIIRGVMAKKAPAVWPDRIKPLPILGAPAWSFSLPGRMARRLRRRLARGKP